MKNMFRDVAVSQGDGLPDHIIPLSADDTKFDSSSTGFVEPSSRASPLNSLPNFVFAPIQFTSSTNQVTAYNIGVNKLMSG